VIEVSQIIIHEADEPNVVAGLFDGDALTCDAQAEIDFVPTKEGQKSITQLAFGDTGDSHWRQVGKPESTIAIEGSARSNQSKRKRLCSIFWKRTAGRRANGEGRPAAAFWWV
jgi:hypothetical protein